MLPRQTSLPQPADAVRIGVGIDTSRYGHYAAFLRDDLQAAAGELQFVESGAGYAQLRQRLEQLAAPHKHVHFLVRLDAAGQYADNLLHYLQALSTRGADATPRDTQRADAAPLANVSFTISCGDPQRNKNYRAALFGGKKSDAVEARAAARFALSERPGSVTPLSPQLRNIRQSAGRLQSVVRQRTRLINQFHHLLALAFPELALLVKDISQGWVLELVHRYPTAKLLAAANAAANADDLAAIPYLPHKHIEPLLEQARSSIASLAGDTAEQLIRDQVRQLRDVRARQKRLEKLLIGSYRQLPEPNQLDTIPGIGEVTAAILTAFILDIDRFDTPGKLVAYFGTLPIEFSSGVDRDGKPRTPRRYVMSRRGNDLVRRYLWMAALSAVRYNPAARPLYLRVVAKHPDKKAIAVGHVMRKLLHLAFAVWKTRKPFDPNHYPWGRPAHVDGSDTPMSLNNDSDNGMSIDVSKNSDNGLSPDSQAAGHKPEAEPATTVVTAACATMAADDDPAAAYVDFAHLKQQLPLARLLDHLGLSSRLRGRGSQQRCACPIHRGDARGRTFSVNLTDNVFHCFDATCGQQGDVIDLWAALHHLTGREAALDLLQTFHLHPAPQTGTEKRHG